MKLNEKLIISIIIETFINSSIQKKTVKNIFTQEV